MMRIDKNEFTFLCDLHGLSFKLDKFEFDQRSHSRPLIERVGDALTHPWGMDFLDDANLVVTERGGKMYKINLADGTRQPITGLPDIEANVKVGC